MVDFQLEVYKFLSENQYDSNNLIKNLTIEEYNVLSRFLIHKPFKFVECDKNVGTALISHKLYEELCFKKSKWFRF